MRQYYANHTKMAKTLKKSEAFHNHLCKEVLKIIADHLSNNHYFLTVDIENLTEQLVKRTRKQFNSSFHEKQGKY